MEFFRNVFWNVSYDGNFAGLLIEILVFLGIWLLVFYLIYFLLAKMLRSKLHRDIQFRLNFLWALVGMQILFLIYLFFLFRYEGTQVLRWQDTSFYFAFAPQLLLFLGTIILFVIWYQNYRRKLQF